MLFFENMKNSKDELQKLRARAESSFNKTSQLLKLLAKAEANLARKENQKVIEKSKKK